MAKQKTIYLLRHGETSKNKKEVSFLGYRSIDNLNETGQKQARRNSKTLKDLHLNTRKIFSSPTPRALEHSEILQRHLNLPIEKINSLSEINLGILEDRSQKEGLEISSTQISNWQKHIAKFEAPLGESALEALERFYEIIEFISETNSEDEDILIVTHCVVIRLFLAKIMKASLQKGEKDLDVPKVDHGTITVVNKTHHSFKFKKVIQNKNS